MNATRHINPSQVAIVRSAVLELLKSPAMLRCDPLAIALALEEISGALRLWVASDRTGTFTAIDGSGGWGDRSTSP
ncbi:hypothetical protein [Phormidesmis priestleyi]